MKDEDKIAGCSCSLCDTELKNACLSPSFCEPCEVEIVKCQRCGKSISSKISKCPECGAVDDKSK